MSCSVADCDRPARGKGLCQAHYARVRRTGSVGTAPVKAPGRGLEARFWEKVDRRGPDECWPWMGSRDGDHGNIKADGPRGAPNLQAHRVAISLAGRDPGDRPVIQTCGDGLCVNPAHLAIGWHHEHGILAPHALDLTGQRFGRLTIVSASDVRSSTRNLHWICRCDCGASHVVSARSLVAGATKSCGCWNSDRAREAAVERNSKDVVDYAGMHSRLKRLLGKASLHPCTGCDRQAQEWSYDHADPDERRSPRGLPFSLDPAHYVPRCVKCHRQFDVDARRGAA